MICTPNVMYCANRFKRMFILFGPALELAKKIGMRFSAVDGFHIFHIEFKGMGLMICTRDGNNNVIPLAWVLCLQVSENKDNWTYMGEWCVRAGLQQYLDLPGSAIIHDRQKGIPYFVRLFGAYDLWCFRHIIGNVYQHIGGKKFKSKLLWDLQEAETCLDWFDKLKKIHAVSEKAAKYMEDLCWKGKIYRWEMLENRVCTHGHRCSNIQEGINGAMTITGLRGESPINFCKGLVDDIGKKFHTFRKEAEKWNPEHPLNEYHANLWREQVCILLQYITDTPRIRLSCTFILDRACNCTKALSNAFKSTLKCLLSNKVLTKY